MRVRKGRASVWTAVMALILGAVAPVLAGPGVQDVTVAQAQKLIQKNTGKAEFVVLDVRTPQEFAEGHLAGAVNVNLLAPDFEPRIAAFSRGKTYLVYCRTGGRSTRAVQIMRRLGFTSIYHMSQGITGWMQGGLPLTPSP